MCSHPASEIRPGILTPNDLNILKTENLIDCIVEEECAIDLHLSQTGWLMKGSVKPKSDETIDMITGRSAFRDKPLDLTKETTLMPRKTYVIPLNESFKLSNGKLGIHGRATGKSSIGRLDVLTRLMCDRSDEFDTLERDYTGSLSVEVTPITFPIVVKEGVSLNQLRLFRGDPKVSELQDEEIGFYGAMKDNSLNNNRCDLSLDLTPEKIGDMDVIAFTTSKPVFGEEEALNLCRSGEFIDPRKYWTPVHPNGDKYIEIKADHFYILRSKERFTLPLDIGVHCQAITENLGEIRIHYAGFVHPGFGSFRGDHLGAPLIFEVRGHTVNAFLRDRDVMARISYYRTTGLAPKPKDGYDSQELKLSRYFDMSKWQV